MMAAELSLDPEGPRRLAVPVRQQREVQVERLRPGDVRPLGIARDPERPHSPLLEFRAPVTQELHLARSGRGPVEEVEEEERGPVGDQLADRATVVRRSPDRRLGYPVAYPQHRRGAY